MNYIRRMLVLLSQVVLIVIAYLAAFLLRFDFNLSPHYQNMLIVTLPVVLLVKLAVFYRLGLLRGYWRYAGLNDAMSVAKAAAGSTVLLFVLLKLALRVPGYPRSVLVIDCLMTFLLVGGAHIAVRLYAEIDRKAQPERRTLVVGAGGAGSYIVRVLKYDRQLELKPVGFVDDDVRKNGIRIHGVKVLGPLQRLPRLVRELGIECVLIAIPSAGGPLVQKVISLCRECSVEFKILPSIREHINGSRNGNNGHTPGVRSVQLPDLLGREPVHIDVGGIRRQLENKVLLITGAGGSIGSELARQVADFNPRELVLLDRSENALFQIDLELSQKVRVRPATPVVADIQDVGTMREIFALYRPDVVFHAAAYKHVPMMERNCFQAVANNVFGTYNLALLARQFQTKSFVMISSDKAVKPVNIMGVTKRVAELIMLGLQQESTRYVAVRFGNVLGSSGSVVPIFQEQIARGGPVTVTHPDACRYFMTIPEAVRLVLQASNMGQRSEIFVLDMGKLEKILDLARNLIRLSGFEPDRDIKITYTGLRPGEKLFEELMLQTEGLKTTAHPKIRVLDGGTVSFAQVREWLDELAWCLEAKNLSALIRTLQNIVPEYQPSTHLLELSEVDRHDLAFGHRRQRQYLQIPLHKAA
jgi:FlaA1/EpsC-like NDP-sugar epimerase